MKASELRIGNWVTDEFGDEVQVFEINEIFATIYEPIPLTPEILEKCGFEVKGIGELYYELELPGYEDCFLYDLKEFSYNLKGEEKTLNITYLHQLQNLYYALTGEELNYQP